MSRAPHERRPRWLEGRPSTPLLEAACRAWSRAAPLLVLDPGEGDELWERGQLWGELLTHGKPGHVAPLSLAEIASACAAELAALTGGKVPGHGKGKRGASSRQHEGPVAPLVAVSVGDEGASLSLFEALTVPLDPDLVEGPINDIIDLRIDTMAGLVRAALGGDPRVAEQLAGAGGEGKLARAAREALRDRPMPGARWARVVGRSVQLEGEADTLVAHVSGRVPARSRRLLLFYTDALEGRARPRW